METSYDEAEQEVIFDAFFDEDGNIVSNYSMESMEIDDMDMVEGLNVNIFRLDDNNNN